MESGTFPTSIHCLKLGIGDFTGITISKLQSETNRSEETVLYQSKTFEKVKSDFVKIMGNPETAVYKFVINPIGTGAGLKEFFEAAKGEKNAKVETVTWYSQLFKIEQLHMFLAFFDMKYLKTITFKMFVPQVKWLMESDELKDVKKCLIGYVMKPGIECKLHINLESWDFLTQLIETFTEIDSQIGANFDMFFALDYRFDDKGFDEILKQNSSFISSDTDSVDRKIYWFEAKRLRYQLIVMSGSDRLKGQIVSGGFAKGAQVAQLEGRK